VCEANGEKLEEVESLTLDSMCTSAAIHGLDKCVLLQELSLIGCGITSLEGFPALPALRKLWLSDNRISSGLDNLADLDNLVELSLGEDEGTAKGVRGQMSKVKGQGSRVKGPRLRVRV
jgi:hypothetical protein